jgi:hypothetical protein
VRGEEVLAVIEPLEGDEPLAPRAVVSTTKETSVAPVERPAVR